MLIAWGAVNRRMDDWMRLEDVDLASIEPPEDLGPTPGDPTGRYKFSSSSRRRWFSQGPVFRAPSPLVAHIDQLRKHASNSVGSKLLLWGCFFLI